MVLILHSICYKLIYWRYKNTQHLMAKVLKYPTVIIYFFFMYPKSTLFNRLNISLLLFYFELLESTCFFQGVCCSYTNTFFFSYLSFFISQNIS